MKEAQKSYEVAMEKNESLKVDIPMLKEFVEGYDQRIVAEGLMKRIHQKKIFHWKLLLRS